MANIGQSIVFKGELSGDEDLEIDGQVEGDVRLANHQLTIGSKGRLKAEVEARAVVVIGTVVGNLTATERIEIQATGVVEGDLKTPCLLVQEGAVLHGRIEMASGTASGRNAAQSASAAGGSPPAGSSSTAAPTPDSSQTGVRKTG
jgi:cytoskeletal protein CcmA (bactofilin family)